MGALSSTSPWPDPLGGSAPGHGGQAAWGLVALGCSAAPPLAHGVPGNCRCVCRREAAAGSPLFSLSTSVFIKPEGNEKGFTFVPARTWQLFNFN